MKLQCALYEYQSIGSRAFTTEYLHKSAELVWKICNEFGTHTCLWLSLLYFVRSSFCDKQVGKEDVKLCCFIPKDFQQ